MLRQTKRKKMQAKLKEIQAWSCDKRMHDPVPEVGRWLRSVLAGALPILWGAPQHAVLCTYFHNEVIRLWMHATEAPQPEGPHHLGADEAG